MQTFSPRKDVLPLAQQQLWPQLRPTIDLGLVLYGGTAIALRVGHRQSVDFGFFTDKSLHKSSLRREMPFLNDGIVLQDQVDTLTVQAPSGNLTESPVKISFFGSIRSGRVGEPEMTDDGVLQVASLPDLLATKLKVILQRAEAKDYQDIAAILRAGVSLECGLASARQIFGNAFQPAEGLRALVYFKGGDLDTLDLTVRHALVESASRVKELPDSPVVSTALSPSPSSMKTKERKRDLDHDPWGDFGR